MANQNSVAGFPNGLFTQSITTAAETPLTVPATGVFAGLPSPALQAGSGLWIGPSPDIQGSVLDGHPFKVRVAGKVFTGAASIFTTKLYNVPATIAAAGTAGTLANDVLVLTSVSASLTGAFNFLVEAQCLWDSVSGKLSLSTGVNVMAGVAPATLTPVSPTTTVYTAPATVSLLNFIPSFTFGTANAANTVQVTEFVIDRV